MTRIRTLLLFLACTFLPACSILATAQAGRTSTAPRAGGAAQPLIAAEHKWVDALQKRDTATLTSVLAPTYVDTDERGHRTGRQGVIASLTSGDLKLNSVTLSDMRAHIYGNAAVVTGAAAQDGTFKGQPLTSNIVFTDTFIRQNGRWRAVASQRSPAPGSPSQ